MKVRGILLISCCLLVSPACGPATQESTVRRGLDDYIRQASALRVEDGQNDGSVWTDQAGYGDAFRDVKARRSGDIVTVQVLESTSAVSEASTASAKDSSVESQFPNLFGLEKKVSELPALVSGTGSQKFTGDASTSRKSVLSTTLTARVLQVFPNRNLLIEGNREVLINGERQLVVMRGVIRPNDISPANIVSSSRIAEMELQVTGRGLVSDAQRPGLLYKILTGVWPF
ncbi:MAG: flagellar basal body L-ring protein FlgH [Acidobacteriota bacterium]